MMSIEDKDCDWSEMDLKIAHEDEDNNLLVYLQKQYDLFNQV